MNIYVGNISYQTDDSRLTELFSEFGEVASARVINDRETGRSKGFAFVEMNDDSAANSAIEALNEKANANINVKNNVFFIIIKF